MYIDGVMMMDAMGAMDGAGDPADEDRTQYRLLQWNCCADSVVNNVEQQQQQQQQQQRERSAGWGRGE